MTIKKINIRIKRSYLILIAGTTWMGVGTLLCTMAIKWLAGSSEPAAFFLLTGIGASLLIHHFGFYKLVDRNLKRIGEMEERPSAFAFISPKSYLLIIVMMTMGILLRHSSFPKTWLSILYIAMGLSLLLSSIRYFRYFCSRFRS